MKISKIYNGFLNINGCPEIEDELKVYCTDFELAISEDARLGSKKHLTLCPFNAKMFWWAPAEKLKQGIMYKYQGNKLGSYSVGPLGHPGDGEYDRYLINSSTLLGSYTSGGLKINIEAKTEEGKSGFYDYPGKKNQEPLPSLTINAEFNIPINELKIFLGLNDISFENMCKEINKIA